LTKARTPNTGWWLCDGGTGTTLIDAEHLTEGDDFWNGAEMFIWIIDGTSQVWRDILDYDQATHTLTFADLGYGRVPTADEDRYYLANKVELIDVEGEWATEDLGGGTWRVYLWTLGGGNPDTQGVMVEASKQTRFLIELGNKSYWVIDGLEIRHCQSHGVGGWSSGGAGHNTVQNCSIHHNEGTGIYGRYNDYGVYRRNFVAYNDYGIQNVGATGVTIEENEVCHNYVDGVLTTGPGSSWATGIVVRRNYIHDQFMWGHPDNLQSYNMVKGMLVEDNLIVNSVQSYMMEGTEDTIYRGNTIIGASAYMIILGHENTFNTTFEHNTMLAGGWGMVAHSANGYAYTDNIIVMAHPVLAFVVESDDTYSADYNLFYHGDGISSSSTCVRWHGSSLSFANYVAQSGHDSHGAYGNPMFTNAPVTVHPLDHAQQTNFLPNRVYLRSTSEMYLISVGDHIELDFDGIDRTVTAKSTAWVEFTPPDERIPLKSHLLSNWKTNSNFAIDLSLQAGSPAIGAASDDGNIGSSVPMPQFIEGDFTGDWVRDIPIWPYQPPPACEVRSWQVLASHGAAEIALEFSPSYVHPGAAGVTKLQLKFGAPVDAGTVDLNSVTIVGAANGDQSAKISDVSLSDFDRLMTITLSAALPDIDTYTVTLSATVQAGDGTDVQGTRSQTLKCLSGDADASGTVDAADAIAIRANAGRDVDAATAAYDVDGSGTITPGDMRALRGRLGHALP